MSNQEWHPTSAGFYDRFADAWHAWKPGDDQEHHPDSWRVTLDSFLRRGITETELERAVAITFSRGREAYWRYFCGIVWTWLKEREA